MTPTAFEGTPFTPAICSERGTCDTNGELLVRVSRKRVGPSGVQVAPTPGVKYPVTSKMMFVCIWAVIDRVPAELNGANTPFARVSPTGMLIVDVAGSGSGEDVTATQPLSV